MTPEKARAILSLHGFDDPHIWQDAQGHWCINATLNGDEFTVCRPELQWAVAQFGRHGLVAATDPMREETHV